MSDRVSSELARLVAFAQTLAFVERRSVAQSAVPSGDDDVSNLYDRL